MPETLFCLRRKRSTRWETNDLVTPSTRERRCFPPRLHLLTRQGSTPKPLSCRQALPSRQVLIPTPRETRMRGVQPLLQVRHRALRPASASHPPPLCQPCCLVASVGCEHMTKNSPAPGARRMRQQHALAHPRLALGLRKSESDPGEGGTVVPKFWGGFCRALVGRAGERA